MIVTEYEDTLGVVGNGIIKLNMSENEKLNHSKKRIKQLLETKIPYDQKLHKTKHIISSTLLEIEKGNIYNNPFRYHMMINKTTNKMSWMQFSYPR